jgi:hypothetical protein
MANNLGRISGQLLKDNLTRNEHDLAFDTDLLFLNVNARYVGVNTDELGRQLQVNGTTTTFNLVTPSFANPASNLTITTDHITSTGNINLSAATKVYADSITTDDIEINNNTISTTPPATNLELRPNGSGTVNINSNLNITGKLYTPYDITIDGSIIFGDELAHDTVSFAADINSDILPSQTQFYSLGADPSTSGNRWNDAYTVLMNGQIIGTSSLSSGGVTLSLRPGKIWYVSVNGNDANVGNHAQGPFLTIKHALLGAQPGDEVFIFPGTYTEIFPLTVPAGVSVKGTGIRAVTVVPTLATNTQDAFLLNGECTVSDLTVKDFYYNSGANTGYGFRFTSGFTVSTRSPYVQNISVITSGVNAGRGALVDGAVANTATKEASMLFHSVTFITPGADALTMTNGVRVEWLNSFTYFANIGLHATRGTTGRLSYVNPTVNLYIPNAYGLRTPALTEPFFRATQTSWEAGGLTIGATLTDHTQFAPNTTITDVQGPFTDFGQDYYIIFTSTLPLIDFNPNDLVTVTANSTTETKFGAEVRSIGSANVYGNYGAYAEGADTLMYLINHNFGYIGAGLDSNNDPSLNNHPNEVVQLGGGKIYYQSLDNKGNFQVGEAFKVNYETGNVTFNGVRVNAGGVSAIGFATDGSTTVIDSTQVSTGSIKFSGHTISSLYGPVNFSSGTNEFNILQDAVMAQDLNVVNDFSVEGTLTIGNQVVDRVQFSADVVYDLRPITTNTYNLGSATNKWLGVYVRELNIGTSLKISGHTVETLVSGTDLQLSPNGSGVVAVPSNNVEITNNLQVDGTTNLKTTGITGTVLLKGSTTRTGNTVQTGDINLTGHSTISSTAKFADIQIDANTVSTMTGDNDLQLLAAGTGRIYVSTNNVKINQNLTVNGTTHAGSLTVHGTTTATMFSDGDIHIYDNIITTTVSNHDLRLGAAGTGLIQVDFDNTQFDHDLTVNGSTSLKNTIVGTGGLTPVPKDITLTGDYLQTGDELQTGNRGISSQLLVRSNAYFPNVSLINNIVSTRTIDTDLQLKAASTGIIDINDNATFNQNLRINSTTYTNGITNSDTITSDTFSDSDIEISTNNIKTTVGNNNLRLLAAGTGIISIPNDAVEFNNNLTVNGSTSLKNTVIGNSTLLTTAGSMNYSVNGTSAYFFRVYGPLHNDPPHANYDKVQAGWTCDQLPGSVVVSNVPDSGDNNESCVITITGGTFVQNTFYTFTGYATASLTLTGNYLQTGNTLQTGNRSISSQLLVRSNAYFDSMSFVNNIITTTDTNTDLSLKAAGTGLVVFDENTTFSQGLTVDTLVGHGITNSGTTTSATLFDTDIQITSNIITTTVGNNDLILSAAGAGIISIPLDPVLIDNDLTVSGISTLKNTTITGNVLHTGNTSQTGNVTQTGALGISNNLTVTGSNAFFTDIHIVDNGIATTISNNDLILEAAGSGIVDINDNATFNQALRVNSIVYTNGLTNTGTITSDIFTDNDIEINDNYITTTVGNNNLILTGNGAGGPKLEQIKFNANVISTETTNQGFTLTIPSGNLNINTATALKLPVGTTVNRPTLSQGEFRFNSTDNLFRGYSTATVSFAGVYSADRRTSVLAHPTNNTLLFTTNTVNNMTIGTSGLTVNSLSVDNNLTFATNVISTAVTNSDLYLAPNGSGQVQMDAIAVDEDEILNLNSSGALILQNTGAGYVSFGGTGGIGIPAGPTVVNTSGVERGDIRFNTDLSIVEIFNGTSYEGLSGTTGGLLNAAEVQEITNLWALVLG